MSHLNAYLQNAYIADGFADDCDELIHRCKKVDFLKFETFCQIWKDMQFSRIYEERQSGAEIAELSEEVIYVAKQYMVSNTDNFEESVAGLFLVYALLNLQPHPGFASLRLVQDDLPAIDRISIIARREKRYDVLYILAAVLIQGPSQCHAAVRERGMEYPVRKYLEYEAIIERGGVRPRGVFYCRNEELDIIKELSDLERRYGEAKADVSGPSNRDRNLNYMNNNMAKELEVSLKNLISGIIDFEPDPDDENEGKNKEPSVQSIKNKAMKSKVNTMKHLVSIDTGDMATLKVPARNSDMRPATGKLKTASPTKPVSSSSPRKRKTSQKKASAKEWNKKPRIVYQDNSTEDSEDDINLAIFSKALQPPKQKIEVVEELKSQPQEIQIEIDALPCFIRTEQEGQLYEIEIIDELKNKKNTEVDVKNIMQRTDGGETSGSVNKPIEDVEEASSSSNEETQELIENIYQMNLSQTEKKFKKSSKLRSTLHRLGLSVVKKEVDDMLQPSSSSQPYQ